MPERLPTLFVHYFRQFWALAGARILVLVGLTVVMTYAEGVAIALFFPVFDPAGKAASSGFTAQVAHVYDWLGLSFEPANVLPLIIVLFMVKGVLQFVTYRYQFSLSRMVNARFRRRALNALSRADYQQVAASNAGFYANLLTTEVSRASGGFLYFVRSLSPALSGSMLFIMVWFLDWRLSLACVVMGLVMVGLTRVTGAIIRRHSISVANESSTLTGLIVQMIHGYKYLRSTGAYERFDRRVETSSQRLLDADFKSGVASALGISLTQPVLVVFLGGILFYQAVVAGGELAPLFVLLMYFLRVMTEVFALQSSWQAFVGYIGALELVKRSTEEFEQSAEPSGTRGFEQLRDAIVFDHVSFKYRTGRVVLDDVSLRIAKHSTVAFVGESGAGKSTLVDLVMGTLRPSDGKVMFDGTNLSELELASLRSHIGYVPQDAVLFDDTVAANIALWSDGFTREQIRSAAERARCLDFIEQMPKQFDTEIGDR
ncbi:MAG TPA: ABC transporter ATP-binding protein, partial [Kofleriaceae bacterium]